MKKPGCKLDEFLNLESEKQGWGKSTALQALCPNSEWFTESLPIGADAKIVIERTTGIWIAEIAELFWGTGASRGLELSNCCCGGYGFLGSPRKGLCGPKVLAGLLCIVI